MSQSKPFSVYVTLFDAENSSSYLLAECIDNARQQSYENAHPRLSALSDRRLESYRRKIQAEKNVLASLCSLFDSERQGRLQALNDVLEERSQQPDK